MTPQFQLHSANQNVSLKNSKPLRIIKKQAHIKIKVNKNVDNVCIFKFVKFEITKQSI